jgi:poly(3-hydroxybutyrate) depolymerase
MMPTVLPTRYHSFRSVLFLLGLLLFPAIAAGPKGTVYQFTVPKQGSMYADPTYYCWLPESVAVVRCVVVHQHGCTREGDAPMMMNDLQWLTFAKQWRAVFVAPKLITGAPGSGSTQCGNWYTITNGSGNTFLAALDTLARRAGHPEIKTIPWALWGHSGGSLWITAMIGAYPERVAAGVAQSGSVEIANVAAALRVPILHHNGRKDMLYNDIPFANGRKKGALWAHAINPNPMWVNGPSPSSSGWDTTVYGHAPHDLRMIAIPWMDYCLASRLPEQAGSSQLKDMDTSGAWLGDTATRAIASAATFTGNTLAASWFPNRTFAVRWKEYMMTGTIYDSTPPPAPYDLNGTYANRQIALKWDADADLEGGIKTFILYRNGAILQTLQYAATTLFTAARGFQRWDDGDQPNPSPAPAMTFTDANVTDTGTYVYQVACVNWSDVAGAKSAAITLKRGIVTGVAALHALPVEPSHTPVSLHMTMGSSSIVLVPGTVAIYDIRGRLLRTEDVRSGGRILLKSIPGTARENVVVVRPRAR